MIYLDLGGKRHELWRGIHEEKDNHGTKRVRLACALGYVIMQQRMLDMGLPWLLYMLLLVQCVLW